jgi:16S rRNA C1402 N4-methylase RsmH
MPAAPNPPQFPPRPTSLAWALLREVIREGDLVIDATAGNGHDTVFLAECVGTGGRVLAFDIQKPAIEATRARVDEAGCGSQVTIQECSHGRILEFAEPASVAAIMFNLGYLPGEDHGTTTRLEETIQALEASSVVLAPCGALSVICYPGHEAGATEAEAVESWLTAKTTDHWRLAKYSICGTLRPAPFLLVARKG